jgi:uncharacterized protein YegP (UPF0339 family)
LYPENFDTGDGGPMAGKVEITEHNAGKFRFWLQAGNGEILAVSEPYEMTARGQNGIASAQKSSPCAAVDLPE